MARRNPFSNQSWEFTRGERNGIIVLVVLILLIIIVPTVIMKQYDRRQFKEQWEKDQAVMNRLDSMLTDTLRLEKRQRSEEYGRESTFPRKEGKKEIRVLDLNSATATDLEQLPGIGPVFAGRIVKYRERLGGYAHISQIKEVYGLPEETYHKIEPYIKCDPGKVLRLDVNTANEEILKTIPISPKPLPGR